MADSIAYFNGHWVPLSQVKIDPGDRGFYRGEVVYDIERTFNGRAFRMEEHIDRLYRSLKYARIDPGLTQEEMTSISYEVITRNEPLRHEIGDWFITQFVTRGPGRRAWVAGPPTVCVKATPIDFAGYAGYYATGAHAAVAKTRSYSPEALDPKIKHYSRFNMGLAELESNDVEADAWPIMLDEYGNITEGAGYNVLLVTNGAIRSPGDRSILQGVSRSMVYDLARQLQIDCKQENVQPYDVYTADEVFFATSSFCVLPVTQVDHRVIGDGKPGPVTQKLLAAWSEAVGLDIVDQALRYAN